MKTLYARKQEAKEIERKAWDRLKEYSYPNIPEIIQTEYMLACNNLEAINKEEKQIRKLAAQKNSQFIKLYQDAHIAGCLAVNQITPVPMGVQIGNGSIEIIMDGPCGFGWVEIRPSYSKFATWLKDMEFGRYESYSRCVTIWIIDYNQSMVKKEAYANAFAAFLAKNGINAKGRSRMD